MHKLLSLSVGAVAVLAIPGGAVAASLDADFSGYAQHDGSAPGVYQGATQYDAFLVLDAVQQDPWYPWDPNKQYTAVLSAPVLSYQGGFLQLVDFGAGTIEIYEDDPGGGGTAAEFANPATFTDGILLLTAAVQNMLGQRVDQPLQPWTVSGDITFTGGAGLGNVDVRCAGTAVMNDFINFLVGTPPPGYEEAYDAQWKCLGPISTDESTWGGVKSRYR